jgi:hypothetical protein
MSFLHLLLRPAADRMARSIERGSLVGAAVGAAAGGAGGVGLTYLLHDQDLIYGNWIAPAVTAGIVFAFVGGMFGSLLPVGRRGVPAEPWNAKVTAATAVRVTNFNRALAPIFVAVALTVLAALCATVDMRDRDARTSPADPNNPYTYVCASMALLAWIVSTMATLWVDVGPTVRVRRLFRAKAWPAADVVDWGFAAGEGGEVRRVVPARGPAELVLLLPGGRTVRVAIAAKAAAQVADVFAAHPTAQPSGSSPRPPAGPRPAA